MNQSKNVSRSIRAIPKTHQVHAAGVLVKSVEPKVMWSVPHHCPKVIWSLYIFYIYESNRGEPRHVFITSTLQPWMIRGRFRATHKTHRVQAAYVLVKSLESKKRRSVRHRYFHICSVGRKVTCGTKENKWNRKTGTIRWVRLTSIFRSFKNAYFPYSEDTLEI